MVGRILRECLVLRIAVALSELTANLVDRHARSLELLQSQIDEGPCVDCVRVDAMIACPDPQADPDRWPAFTRAARCRLPRGARRSDASGR
jgi:hypothetical protein